MSNNPTDTDALMKKSDLIDTLAAKQELLSRSDVELAVNTMLDQITDTLCHGGRVEIRGFGSFSLHHRVARIGRNPKTGESVKLPEKKVPHFKPGKELKEMVDASKHLYPSPRDGN